MKMTVWIAAGAAVAITLAGCGSVTATSTTISGNDPDQCFGTGCP